MRSKFILAYASAQNDPSAGSESQHIPYADAKQVYKVRICPECQRMLDAYSYNHEMRRHSGPSLRADCQYLSGMVPPAPPRKNGGRTGDRARALEGGAPVHMHTPRLPYLLTSGQKHFNLIINRLGLVVERVPGT